MTQSGFGPDLAEVFGPAHQDGGPELVQLLTPEGERVEHPDFSFGDGLPDDELAETVRGFFRDMSLTRRIDVEATALVAREPDVTHPARPEWAQRAVAVEEEVMRERRRGHSALLRLRQVISFAIRIRL